MAGLQQWNKNVQVQANQFRKVRAIDATQSVNLLAGETHLVEFYSPAGYVSYVQAMEIRYGLIGATKPTSGDRRILVQSKIGSRLLGVMDFKCSYADAVYYQCGEAFASPGTLTFEKPSTKENQIFAQRVVFDDSNPLQIRISNNTNGPDNGAEKTIYLWVLDEKVTG